MLTNRQATGNQSSGLTGWQPRLAGPGALSPALLGRDAAGLQSAAGHHPGQLQSQLNQRLRGLGADAGEIDFRAKQLAHGMLPSRTRRREVIRWGPAHETSTLLRQLA